MTYIDTKLTTNRRDLYQTVTDKIIDQLERGVAPWVRPWKTGTPMPTGSAMPVNIKSGKAYSGINVLLLWHAAAEQGFSCNDWLTFKQAKELGGSVRKGEKGTHVVYADKFIPKGERAKAREENRDPHHVYFLKGYCVFNRYQIHGLGDWEAKLPELQPHEAGEKLIAASGADYRIGGAKAFYVPSADYVQMPDARQFPDQLDYYRTAAHELCHWTGHKSRLARDLENRFGSPQYAREELIAEMGAAFVCANLGIEPAVRHADYLGSWLKVLREDNRAIFKAASAASKASDYLLSQMA